MRYFTLMIHPTIIPELMRILVDEENFEWEDAWNITKNSVAYTNHTIFIRSTKDGQLDYFNHYYQEFILLQKKLIVVLKLNLRKYGEHASEVYDMAIIKHGEIHMANLAIVGSYSVNGVAKLHTEILKNITMKTLISSILTSLIIKQMELLIEDGYFKVIQAYLIY